VSWTIVLALNTLRNGAEPAKLGTRLPWRTSSIASGAPAQRAPTTMTS